LVCAHDAGGANQLLYFHEKFVNPTYLLTGPAIKIAENLNLRHFSHEADLDLSDFDLVIVSSNSTPQLSDIILANAQRNGIKTIGVLDHWVNFSTRWSPTPDIVIATDFLSMISCVIHFHRRAKYWPSQYVIETVRSYTGPSRPEQANAGIFELTVLFMSQRIFSTFDHSALSQTCLCPSISGVLANHTFRKVIIRDHFTTDSSECIASLKSRFPQYQFSIVNPDFPIADSLSLANVVIGWDSYALYVARRAGLPVYTLMDKGRTLISPRYDRL